MGPGWRRRRLNSQLSPPPAASSSLPPRSLPAPTRLRLQRRSGTRPGRCACAGCAKASGKCSSQPPLLPHASRRRGYRDYCACPGGARVHGNCIPRQVCVVSLAKQPAGRVEGMLRDRRKGSWELQSPPGPLAKLPAVRGEGNVTRAAHAQQVKGFLGIAVPTRPACYQSLSSQR